MKQKYVQQIVDEVIKERVTLGDIGRAGDGARIGQNIGGKTGAKIGARAGYYSRDIVTAGIVGYALKKLYDKYRKEKDPKKKTVLKAKINKAKAKIKSKKAVKESYNFTNEDVVEIFGEGLAVAAAKGIAKGAAVIGGAFGARYVINKDMKKAASNTAIKVGTTGVAGILAYKLYKKLKDKYNKSKDPKEKAKLKKLVVKAKAKTKKK